MFFLWCKKPGLCTPLVVNKEVFALFIFLLQQHEQTFNHYQTKFSFERVSLIPVSLVLFSGLLLYMYSLLPLRKKNNKNSNALNFID